MMCTLGAVLLFVYHEGVQDFVKSDKSVWLSILAVVAAFSTLITLCCCEGVRRTSPINLIFLTIFTVGESYMVAFTAMQYEANTVVQRCYPF